VTSRPSSSLRRLRLADPRLGAAAAEAVRSVLSSGHLTMGSRVARFEELVAAHSGVSHAVATSSGTTALHLALIGLGIGRGDEVIVADFTHPATGNVVLQAGAALRLVDVERTTFTIDVAAVRRAITTRTRLVIAVDSFGLPANYPELEHIASSHGIPVLADAACSLGARIGDRRSGQFGIAACLSFHPRKIVTTGEGGMVLTDDAALASRFRRLRNHGSVPLGSRLSFAEMGFNYRMSDILAAVGIEQLHRLDEILAARRDRAAALLTLLESCPGVTPQAPPAGYLTSWQSFVVVLDERIDRDEIVRELSQAGIEATIGTYALHLEPAFEGCWDDGVDAPVASRDLARSTLALPLHPGIDDRDLQRIAAGLTGAIATQLATL
jgi:perosamine synthetase